MSWSFSLAEKLGAGTIFGGQCRNKLQAIAVVDGWRRQALKTVKEHSEKGSGPLVSVRRGLLGTFELEKCEDDGKGGCCWKLEARPLHSRRTRLVGQAVSTMRVFAENVFSDGSPYTGRAVAKRGPKELNFIPMEKNSAVKCKERAGVLNKEMSHTSSLVPSPIAGLVLNYCFDTVTWEDVWDLSGKSAVVKPRADGRRCRAARGRPLASIGGARNVS